MRDRPPGLARMPSWAEGHAAVARRVVPGLPRDALVDRAASPEGFARSLAARGDPPRERTRRRFRACRSPCAGPQR